MSRLRGGLVDASVDADHLDGRWVDAGTLRGAPTHPGSRDGAPASARRPRGRLGWMHGLCKVLAQARNLWRDFMGDSAYQRYLEHHGRNHPDHPPLSEKEFWRARAQYAEENVSTGCC